MKAHSYQVTLTPDETGYTVLVPELPGCVSYGETVETALANVKEAIQLHLENLSDHNQDIPNEGNPAPILTTLIHVTR